MGVGEATATTLALVFHELATNSLKYGALSADTGQLDISGSNEGDDIKIVWTERGGPLVTEGERSKGYGSRLVERSVSGQLGGTIDYDWSEGGLIVTLKIRAAKLAD